MFSYYFGSKNKILRNQGSWVHAWMPNIVKLQADLCHHLTFPTFKLKAFFHLPRFNWRGATPMELFIGSSHYLNRLLKNVMTITMSILPSFHPILWTISMGEENSQENYQVIKVTQLSSQPICNNVWMQHGNHVSSHFWLGNIINSKELSCNDLNTWLNWFCSYCDSRG